jgi:osmotically-inducible protein OsmY
MTRTATAHRLDSDIFAEARLALDRQLDVPATVRVHVDNGVATLTGTVRVTAQRAEAERTVGLVRGVRGMVNKITVTASEVPVDFEPPGSVG